jgi:hypothetical protein
MAEQVARQPLATLAQVVGAEDGRGDDELVPGVPQSRKEPWANLM